MGSNLYRALLRGAPLSAPTGNTHAPGPCGMPTGCTRYLPPWPLCTVCARKGVNNLLNHTLPVVETSGSTIQVWGLLEQDSIYGRLRRLRFPAGLSQQNLFSQQFHQDRATTLACFHIYLMTPPCQNMARAHRHVQNRSTLLDSHNLCMLQI